MRILVFDPGESTGWTFYNVITGDLEGGTVRMRNAYEEFGKVFDRYIPDVVVYEKFALYPGAAKAMSWNTFIPCEMIGVIKFLSWENKLEIITEQPAGLRKFISASELDKAWHSLVDARDSKTKHTRDALMHLLYYCRVNKIPAPWREDRDRGEQ